MNSSRCHPPWCPWVTHVVSMGPPWVDLSSHCLPRMRSCLRWVRIRPQNHPTEITNIASTSFFSSHSRIRWWAHVTNLICVPATTYHRWEFQTHSTIWTCKSIVIPWHCNHLTPTVTTGVDLSSHCLPRPTKGPRIGREMRPIATY